MPAIRKLVFIGHLLTAMQEGQEYGEQIAATQLRKGVTPFPRKSKRWTAEQLDEKAAAREAKPERTFRTLETMSEDELHGVMVGLKKECRRRWPKKEELLHEIHAVWAGGNFDRATATGAVMKALCISWVPNIEKLYYEPLLTVLSALRSLVPGAHPVIFVEEHHHAEADNIPF